MSWKRIAGDEKNVPENTLISQIDEFDGVQFKNT